MRHSYNGHRIGCLWLLLQKEKKEGRKEGRWMDGWQGGRKKEKRKGVRKRDWRMID